MNRHLQAIRSGAVTKSNVIGIRKALSADNRRQSGYSVSRTAPKLRGVELAAIEAALTSLEPRVTGELHESGLKLLRSPRYRKRLEPVADIIARLRSFHLIGFELTRGDCGETFVPIYRARDDKGRSFVFRNVAWQSGGDGPEILEGY